VYGVRFKTNVRFVIDRTHMSNGDIHHKNTLPMSVLSLDFLTSMV
jgi:hypothetical protein